MMHYESDYIMRMIHYLRLLYEYLLGMTDRQLLEKGEDAIAEAMARLTGLTPDVALSVSPEQLADMLGRDGEGLSKRFALAELLRFRGDMHLRLGFEEDGEAALRRSLRMYLLAKEAPGDLLRRAYPDIRALFSRFFPELSPSEYRDAGRLFEAAGFFADAEDAFCAMDDPADAALFYRRLADLPERELEAGGLSQEEVEEGYARACRLEKERGSAL